MPVEKPSLKIKGHKYVEVECEGVNNECQTSI